MTKTKKLATSFFMMEFALCACASQTSSLDGKFLIEGDLKNVPDSTVIELFKEDDGGKMLELVDRDTVIDGRFALCDTIAGGTPRKLLLISGSKGFPNMFLNVWAQSGKRCTITGEDCYLPLWNVDSEVVEQQVANEFTALCLPERKRIMQWMVQEADLSNAAKAEDGRPDLAKVDSLCKLIDAEMDMVYLAELNYMQKIPVTAVWLDNFVFYCRYAQYNSDFGHDDLFRSLYAKMSEADKQTDVGLVITEYMNLPEVVDVGDDMADGDLYDLDGHVRHLSEFKEKYILLDFWSQGCGPCVWSMPELEEIADTYRDKMAVVSICQDSEEKWKKYVSKKHLTGNQWNELRKGDTGLGAAYQIKGIPHYVMISPEGKVLQIWSGYGEGSLKAKMQALVK